MISFDQGASQIFALPMESVLPNPDQPRKRFDESALAELAASIKANGLMQPITVQPLGASRYQIVAGERRWRAHKVAGLPTILAMVRPMANVDRDIFAIIENLQRSDITPLEEGRAFQRMLDQGFTPDELAQRLGIKQPWRITDRTQLLRLVPEYLALIERGHLSPSQGFELSRLSPRGQATLFDMIRGGRASTYAKLRAAADGILAAESQTSMFEDTKPTEKEVELLTSFERRLEAVVRLIGSGFKDSEVVALKKINPNRAAIVAVELELIRKHITMIEREIQKVAAQGELKVA